MSGYEENYLDKRPQELCKMCGRCCQMSTTSKSYEELKSLAESGDKGALDFLEIFEPYDSVEQAREIDSDTVDNIISMLSLDGKLDEKNLTFYHCRYLKEDNLCSIYTERKDLCKHFPSSPWAIVPPKCGFEGWLFAKREEIKQKVRKEKEELVELNLLKEKTTDASSLDKIELVIQKINRNIDMYAKYGSRDW